jgi:hypothetical protein
MPAAAKETGLELLGQAGMVAVRVADLASPAGADLGKDGRTALIAAGAGRVRTGDVVVFLKPVAIAPAVVRRDGRVQAAGHPADHARLGVAEERLDALTGTPGVVDQVAAQTELTRKVKGKARRAMTAALAIRFTLLMTVNGLTDSEARNRRRGSLPAARPALAGHAGRASAAPSPADPPRNALRVVRGGGECWPFMCVSFPCFRCGPLAERRQGRSPAAGSWRAARRNIGRLPG